MLKRYLFIIFTDIVKFLLADMSLASHIVGLAYTGLYIIVI